MIRSHNQVASSGRYFVSHLSTLRFLRLAGKSLLKMMKRWPSTISKCVLSLSQNLKNSSSPECAVLGSCAVLATQTVLKCLTTVLIFRLYALLFKKWVPDSVFALHESRIWRHFLPSCLEFCQGKFLCLHLFSLSFLIAQCWCWLCVTESLLLKLSSWNTKSSESHQWGEIYIQSRVFSFLFSMLTKESWFFNWISDSFSLSTTFIFLEYPETCLWHQAIQKEQILECWFLR